MTRRADESLAQFYEHPLSDAGEDLLRNGAGVLGINIDITGTQSFPENARAAELAPVLDDGTRVLRQLRNNLAKDHRFSKGLGPDADGHPVRVPHRAPTRNQKHGRQPNFHNRRSSERAR